MDGYSEEAQQVTIVLRELRDRPELFNERLVPILMTATVTALGLAPLAAGLHSPGQEIEAPMAITVLGGLVSSTVLNLVVLPVLVHRFGGPKVTAAAVPV